MGDAVVGRWGGGGMGGIRSEREEGNDVGEEKCGGYSLGERRGARAILGRARARGVREVGRRRFEVRKAPWKIGLIALGFLGHADCRKGIQENGHRPRAVGTFVGKGKNRRENPRRKRLVGGLNLKLIDLSCVQRD